jgi:RNA polymerase sigma factor (sigma-70 family)
MATLLQTGLAMRDQGLTGSSGSADDDTVQLMFRAAEGDTRAFDRLIERFWTPAFLYALSLTKDSDLAADLAQDAFARLWIARKSIVSPGSVRVYLLRSVRNSFISDKRRWKVRMRSLALTPPEAERSPRTPLQDAESAELQKAMQEAIANLAPRRRQAFTLFHQQDLSYREIAEVMEIRPQSVANLLQAAMTDLRTALQGFLPGARDRG